MKKIIYLLACLSLFSCSKNETDDTKGTAIHIFPKIVTRAQDTTFDEGDAIGVTIRYGNGNGNGNSGNDYVANKKMEYNGSYFINEELTWYDKDESATFFAYYPYSALRMDDFEIKTNQTAAASGYTRSDLMLAKASNVKPNTNGVSLKFDHMFSQLIINVTDVPDGLTLQSMVIGNSLTTATINYENPMVSVKIEGTKKDITAHKVSETVFKAIIIPQTTDLTLAATDTEQNVYNMNLVQNQFESGKSYTATVTLSGGTDITETPIRTTDDTEINGWINGNNIIQD